MGAHRQSRPTVIPKVPQEPDEVHLLRREVTHLKHCLSLASKLPQVEYNPPAVDGLVRLLSRALPLIDELKVGSKDTRQAETATTLAWDIRVALQIAGTEN